MNTQSIARTHGESSYVCMESGSNFAVVGWKFPAPAFVSSLLVTLALPFSTLNSVLLLTTPNISPIAT